MDDNIRILIAYGAILDGEPTKQEENADESKKDVVLSLRLKSEVVERFNLFALYNRTSKKKALEKIITEYLSGRGLDAAGVEILRSTFNVLNKGNDD